jgi:hypothetical protein
MASADENQQIRVTLIGIEHRMICPRS